jgi:alkanesulfonate monooxygenase
VSDATPPVEVAWFSALCDDDYELPRRARPGAASKLGALPQHRAAGRARRLRQHPAAHPATTRHRHHAFAAGVAPQVPAHPPALAVRCGEDWPPQLARQLATLDRMLGGRLTVNIISSDLPGEAIASEPRYRAGAEVMQILRTLLDGESLTHQGEFYRLKLDPPRVRPSRAAPAPSTSAG